MSYPCGDRYQIVGYLADGSTDSIGCESRLSDALRVASRHLAEGYVRTEVYDVMARRGAVQLWDADGTVLERRPV